MQKQLGDAERTYAQGTIACTAFALSHGRGEGSRRERRRRNEGGGRKGGRRAEESHTDPALTEEKSPGGPMCFYQQLLPGS
jgi:hypothetical protein